MKSLLDKMSRSLTESKCANCGHVRRLNEHKKVCPNCKKLYRHQDAKVLKEGLPGVLVIVLVVWFFWGGEESDRKAAASEPPSAAEIKAEAQISCERAVREQAKFPSKADFPFFGPDAVYSGETVKVRGRVELMNALGAMIPHHFLCAYHVPTKSLKYVNLEPGG